MTRLSALNPEMLSVLDQRRLPVLAVIAVKVAVCVTTWTTRRQTRRALHKMEQWQMDDIGVTQEQAFTEAARVFWKS